eukprot:Sspe_Gene.49371::Locus_26558_Transcript_4_4_Confidence_0.636_Length_334::g.49371::m.49371
MLFIRDTRLQNIGEFASVLLHCLGHIKAGTIAEGCNDASPAFMYEYHGLLELLAEEMFYVKSKKAIPRPNLPRQHFRMNAILEDSTREKFLAKLGGEAALANMNQPDAANA